MGIRVGVCEFLEKVSKLKKPEEKIAALKMNDSLILRVILQGCFDPNVIWDLPEGVPPYRPNKLLDQENVLIAYGAKIRYFIKGFNPNLSRQKREKMFVELLENVAPKDAELLCAIKDKKLPFKGLTKEHVLQGLPELFKDEQEQA